jgi:hypothetical protein
MPFMTRLFIHRDFRGLGLLVDHLDPSVTYRFVTADELRSAGAHDQLSSFEMTCAGEPGGGYIIFFRDRVFVGDGRADSRFNAYECPPDGGVADPRLEPGLEDRTTNILLVRGRPVQVPCLLTRDDIAPLLPTVLAAIGLDLPADHIRDVRARFVPAPRFAPTRVLLAIDVDLFIASIPIARDVTAEATVYFDVIVDEDGALMAEFITFYFDADGFRPVRREVERRVNEALNNTANQDALGQLFTTFLNIHCQHPEPLLDVYLLPGDERAYVPGEDPLIGNIRDSNVTIVCVSGG